MPPSLQDGVTGALDFGVPEKETWSFFYHLSMDCQPLRIWVPSGQMHMKTLMPGNQFNNLQGGTDHMLALSHQLISLEVGKP